MEHNVDPRVTPFEMGTNREWNEESVAEFDLRHTSGALRRDLKNMTPDM